jgi:hypothetical protein
MNRGNCEPHVPVGVTLSGRDFENLKDNVLSARLEVARAVALLAHARDLRKGFDGTRKLGAGHDPECASFAEEQALSVLASAHASLEAAVGELDEVSK